MVRNPAVAGQFYPADKEGLLEELASMIPDSRGEIDAVGAVVPHAGYVYSGRVAGEVYAKLKPKDTYIVLSPNHTGSGERFAALGDPWHTPLGDLDVDQDLLAAMMDKSNLITDDPAAHLFEHSIEVQLPFIQKTAPGSKIVPITVQEGDFSQLKEVAGSITSAIKESDKDVVIIASSDMTHYESRESAQKKDEMAIRKVLDVDPEGLLNVVEKNGITMCGYIATAIMLICANELGAKKGELIKYSDSGDISGDTVQVVGYAGIIVY